MSACFLDVCHIHIGWTWISTRDRAPCDRPTWFFCLADWPALGPSCSPGPMWSRSGRRVLRGMAWTQTLHCLARLLTHPSHTRHPVLQYLCCLCVCVYICFCRVISESVFSLSFHWLSTSAVTDVCVVRTRYFTLYLETNNPPPPPPKKIKNKKINEETYCGVFELDLKVFEDYYDSFCCAVCTAGPRCWITSG